MHNISLEVGAQSDADRVIALCAGFGLRTVFITWRPNEKAGHQQTLCQELTSAGLNVIPHLVARNFASENAFDSALDFFTIECAVSEVFLLGGDRNKPDGPFDNALNILQRFDSSRWPVKTVHFAAYPEGHHLIGDDRLAVALKQKIAEAKQRGLRVNLVSQVCTDLNNAFRWSRTTDESVTSKRISIAIGSCDTILGRKSPNGKSAIPSKDIIYDNGSLLEQLAQAVQYKKNLQEIPDLHLISFHNLEVLNLLRDQIKILINSW